MLRDVLRLIMTILNLPSHNILYSQDLSMSAIESFFFGLFRSSFLPFPFYRDFSHTFTPSSHSFSDSLYLFSFEVCILICDPFLLAPRGAQFANFLFPRSQKAATYSLPSPSTAHHRSDRNSHHDIDCAIVEAQHSLHPS